MQSVGRLLKIVGLVAALLVGTGMPAAAQITTGYVSGVVHDAQGLGVPGATVVLISETRDTRSAPVVTGNDGGYSFPNLAPDRYAVEVALSGFKTTKRGGIQVSPGDRLGIAPVVLELGGASEVVNVTAEAAVVQSQSGERSFTISTESVANLPMLNRNFATLAALAPGVDGTNRIGGGGDTNFMMDGVGAMDTGSNRLLMAVNTESVAEVKILTSGYQAEYGRSSGLQISAVTKSGSNQLHGSLYDVERNSAWNANSRENILNGDPKTKTTQRDWGFSIGGPVGRPGGDNKIFFFYAQEMQPRTSGNNVVRYRVPTEAERRGDFSASTDQNGNVYNLIRDTSTGLACTATNTAGCFRDGGVLGRIPTGRLYQTGLNVLKQYPLPNLDAQPGQSYNFELTRPAESLTSYQPVVRVDVQPTSSLRASVKFSAWHQPKKVILGNVPGFDDSIMHHPFVGTLAATVNYTLTSSTFIEATWGRSSNEQTGCALNGNGANFCRGALPVNSEANYVNAGLGELPFIFPDANILNPSYYAYGAVSSVNTPIWDGTRLLAQPAFQYGNRVSPAPLGRPFPGFLNTNRTYDIAGSLTKLQGRHTLKFGVFNTQSFKAQQRGGWNGTINFGQDTNSPIDSSFGFANAALGIFNSYTQASAYVEGNFVYRNTEFYAQDNWKISNRLTLDYGVRLVQQTPQYDELGQASNFLPERWNPTVAPRLYEAGCSNGAVTCSGATRQARNPITKQLLGSGSSVAIGTIVPNTGDETNGLFLSGQGIAKTTFTYPSWAAAPRVGAAYDLTGTQKVIVRGSVGLFFDRPDGNAIMSQVQNPPYYTSVTLRYGALQTLKSGGLSVAGVPSLSVYEYDSQLPSSTQWNSGVQVVLPWNSMLDVAYVGQHSYNQLQGVNLNAIDLGAAYLKENQDSTLGALATPGAGAVLNEQLRPFRGYGDITQQWSIGWRTFHSLQFSFNRRFSNGMSFGFNDTITLSDRQAAAARLEHAADGSYSIRADQAEANDKLGNAASSTHRLKGNFVWDLPDMAGEGSLGRRIVSALANDWQVSGVWTGATGAPYAVGYSYNSNGSPINLTGSPNFTGRVSVVGDPGAGCSSDPLRQFNTAAFQGPGYNSVGLESSNNYLRGCMSSSLDLSLQRQIRLGGKRSIQLRFDVFNAANEARITGRNTTMNLSSPSAPTTISNLPFDQQGNLVPARARPTGAGFGVVNNYQDPRTVQAQVRFMF